MPRKTGFVTLDYGEQALIYDKEGRARVEEGPQRIFLWLEKFVPLTRYSAAQNQYLEITYRDGRVEHKPGPCAVFKTPTIHGNIKQVDGVSLDASEVLVVYKRDQQTNKVSRYIKQGPALFIPRANEWLHEFAWHGSSSIHKTHKVPGALKFTKLRIIPDQFYYNVNTRSADDTIMKVKLMVFFELHDIEQMLNSTQDPIADFINCVTADVQAFTTKLTYLEFLERSNALNELDKYPQLKERCKGIGFEVTKVVYRGYLASEQLQKMHDQALKERTKLKIQFETEEQNQILTDMKLKSEMERAATEQKMEIERLRHTQEMEKAELEHKLLMKRKDVEEHIKQLKREVESELNVKKAQDEEKLLHYKKLSDLNVSLSDYIISENPKPEKVVHVVAGSRSGTNLHLYQAKPVS